MRKAVVWYILFFSVFSLIFILLFHTPLFASQQVLFYRGIILLSLVALFCLVAGIYVAYKTKLVRMETVLAAVIMSASIHLVIFVVFPVTFDRSVTMYLLNTLHTGKTAECKGLDKSGLEHAFVTGYVKDQDAVGRRIREQAITDFVRQQGQCVSITQKGIEFIRFSQIVKQLYGVK